MDPAKYVETIRATIRWHYCDLRRGEYSADPSCSGLDEEIISEMESYFSKEQIDELRREGERWAEYELEKTAELCGRTLKWSDIPATS